MLIIYILYIGFWMFHLQVIALARVEGLEKEDALSYFADTIYTEAVANYQTCSGTVTYQPCSSDEPAIVVALTNVLTQTGVKVEEVHTCCL